MISGTFPPELAGLTTLETQAIDLGMLVPLAISAGVLLHRNAPWGYLLAGLVMMFGVMMFIYRWSSAFMLYWLILNIVSGYQSWVLGKQFGLYGGGDSGSGGGGGTQVVETPTKPLAPM